MFNVPASKAQIKYIRRIGGAVERRELPLRILVIGDFTLKESESDDILADREKLNVNLDNLNDVIRKQNISIDLTVPNHLDSDSGEELTVSLKIDSLDSFHPEAVVSQFEKQIGKNVSDQGEALGRQLDEILHHPKFRQLESAWRALHFALSRIDFRSNIRVEILNISKAALYEDFERAGKPLESGLFIQVYTQAYDQYGAEPVSLIAANYEFNNEPEDIELLQNIADVAFAAQCPFIASVGPRFFGVESFMGLAERQDLRLADNAGWNSFRESYVSRYVCLTLPKFMLRLPYGEDAGKVESFDYNESFGPGKYLWGISALALASNIARSFAENGWPVNLTAPESGGIVGKLPLHVYEVDDNTSEFQLPLEIMIPDSVERKYAENGLTPMLIYDGDVRVEGVFISANSVHEPEDHGDENRFLYEFPSTLLLTRIMHYLRVIQRDELGRGVEPFQVQEQLSNWLGQYVCGPNPRSKRLKAERPFAEARVEVQREGNTGLLKVMLYTTPHHQVDDTEFELSLMAEMPEAR